MLRFYIESDIKFKDCLILIHGFPSMFKSKKTMAATRHIWRQNEICQPVVSKFQHLSKFVNPSGKVMLVNRSSAKTNSSISRLTEMV